MYSSRMQKIILTHIADRLHPPHDVLEKNLIPEGLIPAYEGMSVVLEAGNATRSEQNH